jgi:hypothetical protein
MSTPTSSVASASRSTATSTDERFKSVVFELRERVSLEAAARMLRSAGFARLVREDPAQASIRDTVNLAALLGGYVPVQYYIHDAQEGFGRMKSEVMVTGMRATPYVRMKREARACLAGGLYWDVDMVNCQPTLLEQTLRKYGVPCPLLGKYVSTRDECLREVMDACGVTRDEAKNLFLRLVYFGGVRGWVAAVPHARGRGLPPWIEDLRAELRASAHALVKLPQLAELVERHAVRGVAMMQHLDDASIEEAHTDPLASVVSLYLQTLERECVCALVRAITASSRAVGGIVYDGVLVQRLDGETGPPGPEKLREWEVAVTASQGYSVSLVVKELRAPDEWYIEDPSASESVDEAWMDGRVLMTYEDVKRMWEVRAFKVVQSCNYVREVCGGARTVMSEKQLTESYRHLRYAEVERTDSGRVRVSPSRPFIARWINDNTIRTCRELVFAPPPKHVAPGAYNIWDGFAVEGEEDRPTEPEGGWAAHAAVRYLVDFHTVLFGREIAQWVLDWTAHMYQRPGVKNGLALLLKGSEGVGKNRFTDLHRAMLGRGRFLQTATPSTTLYGRFNGQREGRILIVINESSGSDNFAANDVIKDMITCDEFQLENKGVNAYTLSCCARFIFTTNNDNCLRVNPDSRRYVVVEVSSALKGNTEYFRELSRVIEDPMSRRAFYEFLMARDVSTVDWINHRPVTEYLLQAIAMNLPYEHQFLKDLVLRTYREENARRIDSHLVKRTSDELYDEFTAWLALNRVRYETSRVRFGMKVSHLVRNDAKMIGFVGLTKTRRGHGTMYMLDVRKLIAEMREERWLTAEEDGF